MARTSIERLLRYPEYQAFKIVTLNPHDMVPDKYISTLNFCMTTNSTLIIFTQKACIFLPPTEFIKAKQMPEEEQEVFLENALQLMQLGKRFSIKIPNHKFSDAVSEN